MRLIIAFLAVAVIAMSGIAGFQAALGGTATETVVENETWEPVPGNITTLNDSELNGAEYNDTVTVRDSNATTMTDGTDYEWYDGNGTVKAIEGGGLDGEPNATITYDYTRPDEEQLAIAGILSHIPQVMGFVLVLAPLVFLLKVAGGG